MQNKGKKMRLSTGLFSYGARKNKRKQNQQLGQNHEQRTNDSFESVSF